MTAARPRPPAARRAEKAREKAAARRRPRALGLDAIVDVALRIVDREGVDAVSMRRVAAEFDTGPASLYAHVANKEELLQLVLARVIDEIEVPDTGDWQEMLRAYLYGGHAVFARHNDIARINFAHIPSGDRVIDYSERLLAAMLDDGVPVATAAWTLDIVSLYLTADAYEGYLYGKRFGGDRNRDPEQVGAEYFRGVDDYFASLSPERYPQLVAHRELITGGDGEQRFAFGVELLIAGIAAQVPRR